MSEIIEKKRIDWLNLSDHIRNENMYKIKDKSTYTNNKNNLSMGMKDKKSKMII